MYSFPLIIQTYNSNTNIWGTKEFFYKEDFLNYVELQFKEPGKYDLKNTSIWKMEYYKFEKKGYYTASVKGTYESKKYWSNEKDKCIKGVEIDDIFIAPF